MRVYAFAIVATLLCGCRVRRIEPDASQAPTVDGSSDATEPEGEDADALVLAQVSSLGGEGGALMLIVSGAEDSLPSCRLEAPLSARAATWSGVLPTPERAASLLLGDLESADVGAMASAAPQRGAGQRAFDAVVTTSAERWSAVAAVPEVARPSHAALHAFESAETMLVGEVAAANERGPGLPVPPAPARPGLEVLDGPLAGLRRFVWAHPLVPPGRCGTAAGTLEEEAKPGDPDMAAATQALEPPATTPAVSADSADAGAPVVDAAEEADPHTRTDAAAAAADAGVDGTTATTEVAEAEGPRHDAGPPDAAQPAISQADAATAETAPNPTASDPADMPWLPTVPRRPSFVVARDGAGRFAAAASFGGAAGARPGQASSLVSPGVVLWVGEAGVVVISSPLGRDPSVDAREIYAQLEALGSARSAAAWAVPRVGSESSVWVIDAEDVAHTGFPTAWALWTPDTLQTHAGEVER